MINRLVVRNYKSIRDLDIALRPLMVLVGPNASGKSNLLDTFTFLREAATAGGITKAIHKRGGYESVVWNGNVENAVVVQANGDYPDKKGDKLMFNLVAQATLVNRDIQEEWTREGFVPYVEQIVAEWAFYHFLPHTMRGLFPAQQESRLAEDGRNLSGVIHTLRSAEDPAYQEIEELFKVFVPEAEKLISPLQGNATSVAFRQRGLGIPIGANAMSDGTLFGLALIVALFAPQRPRLIGIEAPDMELHPYLMEHVAELLRTASQYTQIIITTHSPFLLDCLPPESIAIVEKEDGETRVRWAEDKEGVKEAIKLLGAGEAWRAGHLGGVPA